MSANAKEFNQIMKLPVDVATDGDGCPDRLDVGLLRQDLFRLRKQCATLP
jgi:hypothetical protein